VDAFQNLTKVFIKIRPLVLDDIATRQTHTQADERQVIHNLLGRCNQNENTAVSQPQLATIYDTLITFVHSNDCKLT